MLARPRMCCGVVRVTLDAVLLLALAGAPLKPHLVKQWFCLGVWDNLKFQLIAIVYTMQFLYCACGDVVNECAV